jgi:BirA family biotin operon repressor/biotin-[acetyl-CoA-carboxylase] ligase
LALYDALQTHTNGQSLQIKWPNDILLNGKKLSGILCENIGQGASIVGIGLNITPPDSIPETFQGTFLNAAISPGNLANAILTCLNSLLALYGREGWSQSLHNSYLQRCATIGKKVHWIRAENNELTGLVRGLTPSGHLELVGEDGTVHVIHSGEIFDKR